MKKLILIGALSLCFLGTSAMAQDKNDKEKTKVECRCEDCPCKDRACKTDCSECAGCTRNEECEACVNCKGEEILPLMVMGVLLPVSSLTLFESYNHMDVGIASTLLSVYPLMVALIMSMVFKERLRPQTLLRMGVALGGIGLLYKSGDGSTLGIVGTLLVFRPSLSYAIYIVGINRPVLKDMATLKVTFYVLLLGTSLFIARFLCGKGLIIPDAGQWYLWGDLIALAVFPTAISFLCTTSAIQYIGSTPTAILGALEPVTVVFFGVVFFGEVLTPRELTGLSIIVLSVTWVIAGGNITTSLIRIRKLFPRLSLRHKKR